MSIENEEVRLQGQLKVLRYVEKKHLNYILIIFHHFKRNEIEVQKDSIT